MNWYYKIDNKVTGPLSESTLKELHTCGIFSENTLLRKEDSTEWIAYSGAFIRQQNPQQKVTDSSAESTIIKFHCKHCQQHISTPVSTAGNSSQCPACDGVIRVPYKNFTPVGDDIKNSESNNHNTVTQDQSSKDRPSNKEFLVSFLKSLLERSKIVISNLRAKIFNADYQANSNSPQQQSVEQINSSSNISSPQDSSKKFDWKFPIGIAVAVLCTIIIVNSNGSKSTKPTSSAYQSTHGGTSSHSACQRCRGSGQLVGQCKQCYGAGTIVTKNANYDGLEVPSQRMRLACPGCRGTGQAPVPCNRCRGRGY